MLSIEEYRADPCGTLSIPYYKASSITTPPGLRIVHHRDFHAGDWPGWTDTPYFRLYQDLRQLPRHLLPPGYVLSDAGEDDCADIAEQICLCYGCDMRLEEVRSWRQRPCFHPALWLLVRDAGGRLAGSAIAEFDPAAGEGSLEWIQTDPDCRRLGIGSALVSALLERLAGMADFATVSGKLEGPAAALYRRCGFTGDDIWHILTK